VLEVDLFDKFSEESLDSLKEFDKLRHLKFESPFTVYSAEMFGTLRSLESIEIKSLEFTDEHLELLAKFGLPNLTKLSLYGSFSSPEKTSVTGAGLNGLGNLKSLRKLSLFHMHLADGELGEYKKANPDVDVIADHLRLK